MDQVPARPVRVDALRETPKPDAPRTERIGLVDEFLQGARKNLEAAHDQGIARAQFADKRVETGGARRDGRVNEYPFATLENESMALEPQGFAIRGSARITQEHEIRLDQQGRREL